jgi:NADH-quinone oxidoreductase subunit N
MFNNFVAPQLIFIAPEIFLLVMACVILLLDTVVKSPRRTISFALTQLTLAGCVFLTLALDYYQAREAMPKVIHTFGNMFVRDMMSEFLKFLVYLAVMATLFYSRAYIAARQAIPKGEYLVMALLATLGMMVMISANHFLTLYLGLEILSLSLYAMVAMNRESAIATEAAIKYFILGALASGLLLYGMSMIYGVTGSLEIGEISQRIYSDPIDKTVLVFGVVFLVAGLAFKLGLVPFHMWIPDVYHGAPTSVTLFIAAAPKLAAFAILMRLLVHGQMSQAPDWQAMLIVLSVLSMAVGNLVAIMQSNLKRMLAYSAISHMGFMLLGIVAGVEIIGADVETNRYAIAFDALAHTSAMFYLVSYVLTTLAAFGIIMLMSRAGHESDELEDFKGLNQRHPWLAAMMMIVMLSLAGIPGTIGFFAKFFVLRALVYAGHYWLAIAAVLFSLIGAFYYLRVLKLMYFDEPVNAPRLEGGWFVKTLISVNTLAIVALGLFPQVLIVLCGNSIRHVGAL